MFDDLRGGINTRLYSKNKYDTKKNSFLKNRSKEDQNIMKIDNNGQFTNYELFNKEFNKNYKEMEEEFNKINKEKTDIEKKNEFTNLDFDSTPIKKNLLEIYDKPVVRKNTFLEEKKEYQPNNLVNSNSNSKLTGKKKGYQPNNLVNSNSKLTGKKKGYQPNNLVNNKINLLEKKYSLLIKKYHDANNPINNKLEHLEKKYNDLEKKYTILKQQEFNKRQEMMKQQEFNKRQEMMKQQEFNKRQEMMKQQELNLLNQSNNKLFQIIIRILHKNFAKIPEKIISDNINKYNLTNQNCSPAILLNLIETIKKDYNDSKINIVPPISKPFTNNENININENENENEVDYFENGKMEKHNNTKIESISIDSNNRDNDKWKNSNEFQINFINNLENYKKKGYVGTLLNNVVQVQLVSAIMIKNSINGNNLENYPYIILEVEEFNGGNGMLSKTILGHMTFDIDTGKYKKSVPRYDNEYLIKFDTPKNFNSLTFKIKTPDGKLYNFGKKDIKSDENEIKSDENESKSDIENNLTQKIENSEISLMFKITKEISNLNKNMNI